MVKYGLFAQKQNAICRAGCPQPAASTPIYRLRRLEGTTGIPFGHKPPYIRRLDLL